MELVGTEAAALDGRVAGLEEEEGGHAEATAPLQQEVTWLKQNLACLEQKNQDLEASEVLTM